MFCFIWKSYWKTFVIFVTVLSFLFCAPPLLATYSDQSTTHTVIIDFQSSRPLPVDFSPVVCYADSVVFSGSLKSHVDDRLLTTMNQLSGTVYSAHVPGGESVSAIFVDQPGFLRGFSYEFDSPYVNGTTMTITLPDPGSLHLNVSTAKMLNEQYCVRGTLRNKGLHFFEIVIPTLPLPEWNANFNDLAPGNYQIFATVRTCAHKGGGPATLAGSNLFTIKSNFRTEFQFPLVRRHDLKYHYTTANMEITPIER